MDSKAQPKPRKMTGNPGQAPGTIRLTCMKCEKAEDFTDSPPVYEPGTGALAEVIRFSVFKGRWVFLQVVPDPPQFICRVCVSAVKSFFKLITVMPGLGDAKGGLNRLYDELFKDPVKGAPPPKAPALPGPVTEYDPGQKPLPPRPTQPKALGSGAPALSLVPQRSPAPPANGRLPEGSTPASRPNPTQPQTKGKP